MERENSNPIQIRPTPIREKTESKLNLLNRQNFFQRVHCIQRSFIRAFNFLFPAIFLGTLAARHITILTYRRGAVGILKIPTLRCRQPPFSSQDPHIRDKPR
uniref:Uncharacterized protein LOC105637964 n=1 Tax=Rhizophora mucronata TaxID=61149 RepID=A0A2P2JAL8_RHIMU